MRPGDNEYDSQYWNSSGTEPNSFEVVGPNTLVYYYQGTLQEFMRQGSILGIAEHALGGAINGGLWQGAGTLKGLDDADVDNFLGRHFASFGEATTAYTFFDSHYYFDSRLTFRYHGDVYVSGGSFHAMAGTYDLPLHEGHYTVEGGLHPTLTMSTRGQSHVYDHPLVIYLGACAQYDSGWYSWFNDRTTTDAFPGKLLRPTIFQLEQSYSC